MKKYSLIKTGALFIILLLIVIQFIDADKNITVSVSANSIEKHYEVPDCVQSLLKNSCYDCHSNTTSYPWYNNIQPLKIVACRHVNSGKRHLNFDEFAACSNEKKLEKMDEITETVQNGEMPLESYTIAHQNARLSASERSEIVQWAASVKKQIR